MNIRHPWSFFLLIAAIVLTAALTVTFSWFHIVGLVFDIAIMTAVRASAHREGGGL